MKQIKCSLDNEKCDLDKKQRGCRHIKFGDWSGKCPRRYETKAR